ncbi:hypothetical protein Clacol_001575 [Clathrus columnatus]|uniref:Uncharacterized protein n=1 Tax=Clathrus columnatus TaxID=1419009 RepID=A0AAV5A2C6_9AGAM|nr:hypothetical protein Clacol_001575 [Clathrus columnatus]
MKLPTTVKHLLTLRRPQANPSPSWERLHGIFTPTLAKAAQHNARDGWLVLATSTLLTANVPAAVSHLYRYVSRREPLSDSAESLLSAEERTAQAAIIREAALKSVIFVGVPRVILTLEALSGALENDVKASLRKVPFRVVGADNAEEFTRRGQALWKHIYAPHDVKLADKLAGYHPDFMSFITTSYGVVFSPWFKGDPGYGPGNLSRTLGSVVGVACLRTESGVGPQLISHVYGLLKSNVEYEGKEPTDGEKWLASEQGTEWVINSIDQIGDVARSGIDAELKARL